MKYIEAFREGDKISEVYLCKYRRIGDGKKWKSVLKMSCFRQ